MTATARCGNRALALQLYRTYELLLARELAISPMPETVALITRIAGAAPPPPALAGAKTDYHATLLRTRDQIATTLSMIERVLLSN
jgi:DNA-binding SARP family transcriptional activator